jgi:hypothetical protein
MVVNQVLREMKHHMLRLVNSKSLKCNHKHNWLLYCQEPRKMMKSECDWCMNIVPACVMIGILLVFHINTSDISRRLNGLSLYRRQLHTFEYVVYSVIRLISHRNVCIYVYMSPQAFVSKSKNKFSYILVDINN